MTPRPFRSAYWGALHLYDAPCPPCPPPSDVGPHQGPRRSQRHTAHGAARCRIGHRQALVDGLGYLEPRHAASATRPYPVLRGQQSASIFCAPKASCGIMAAFWVPNLPGTGHPARPGCCSSNPRPWLIPALQFKDALAPQAIRTSCAARDRSTLLARAQRDSVRETCDLGCASQAQGCPVLQSLVQWPFAELQTIRHAPTDRVLAPPTHICLPH